METEKYECPNCGNIVTWEKNFSGMIRIYCPSCNSTHFHYNQELTKKLKNKK